MTRTASVSVSIGLKDGAPHFASSGFSSTTDAGGMVTGIVANSGDVDISNIGAGNVSFSISLDAEAWGAGYRFPSPAHQAIAIVYYPANATTAPAAVFGPSTWPAEFSEPSISADGKKLQFVDADDNDNAYEYSVALNKPGGGTIVLDPKIKNGGHD
jgi:hypothetical protein